MAGVRLGNVMVTAMAAAERPAGCHESPPGGGEEAAQPWEALCSSSERIESRPKMRMRRAGGQSEYHGRSEERRCREREAGR